MSQDNTVYLDGCSLTPEILYKLSEGKSKIALSEKVW